MSAVPVGKVRIVTRVVARNASASLAGFSGEDGFYFGFDAGATGSGNLTLSPSAVERLTSTARLIQSSGDISESVVSVIGAAGEVFGISVAFTSITATVDIDVFYYDVDA